MRETAPRWEPRTVTGPGRRPVAARFARPMPTPSGRRSGSTPRSGPPAQPALEGFAEAELAIVGGGLSGLWAAVLAKERDPRREVSCSTGGRIADAASGRNGGFCSSFLTHGIANGMARFPEEMPDAGAARPRQLRRDRRDDRAPLDRLRVRDRRRSRHRGRGARGRVAGRGGAGAARARARRRAARPRRRRRAAALAAARGRDVAAQRRGAGRPGAAVLGPRSCRAPTSVYGSTSGHRVESLERAGAGVALRTPNGGVQARQALLATSAFPGLVGAIRRRVVPVWDYVLVTEPLDADPARGDRLAQPPGDRRCRQPVPLLCG